MYYITNDRVAWELPDFIGDRFHDGTYCDLPLGWRIIGLPPKNYNLENSPTWKRGDCGELVHIHIYLWHGQPCNLLVKPVFKKGIKRNALTNWTPGTR